MRIDDPLLLIGVKKDIKDACFYIGEALRKVYHLIEYDDKDEMEMSLFLAQSILKAQLMEGDLDEN